MCAVSNIGDDYTRNPFNLPKHPADFFNPISRVEFDALKKEVGELKKLLLAAKEYDKATGQEDCEMENKVALLKKIAEVVGVNLDEVFR